MRRITTPPLLAVFIRLLVAGQQHRASQFAAVGAAPGRVVFLGDSITEGGLWDEWFPNVAVLNRGIGGERTANVLRRLDTAVNEPTAVFLLIGTNDLMALESHEETARNVAAILAGIEDGCARHARVRAERHATRQGLPGRGTRAQAATSSWSPSGPSTSAASTSGPPWPPWTACSTPEFTRDRLHLNGRGYRTWVKVLEPLVTPFASA